jgi:hypothetical protein
VKVAWSFSVRVPGGTIMVFFEPIVGNKLRQQQQPVIPHFGDLGACLGENSCRTGRLPVCLEPTGASSVLIIRYARAAICNSNHVLKSTFGLVIAELTEARGDRYHGNPSHAIDFSRGWGDRAPRGGG